MPPPDRSRARFGQARALIAVGVLLGLFSVLTHRSDEARAAVAGVRSDLEDVLVGVLPRPSLPFAGGDRIGALEAEIADLSLHRTLNQVLAERMARYEALLAVRDMRIAPGVAARTVAESRGPFDRTRLVAAGRRDGVTADAAAVNERGLVGRAVRVGERSSRILLLTDFNSRVPVLSARNGVRGIARGDGAAPLVLENIDAPGDIAEGDLFLTSGEDGRLPRGLLVGQALRDGDGWRIGVASAAGTVDYVRFFSIAPLPTPEAEPAAPLTTIEGAGAP